jgi:hypothetical protein
MLNDDPNRRTSYISTIQIGSFLDPSGILLNMSLDDAPYTRWNDPTKTCEYALRSIRYQVIYTALGSIDHVVAFVESLHLSEFDRVVNQRFAIQFTSLTDINITKSLKNNNLVPRSRSGNPGYIFESVTLGGVLTTVGNGSQTFVDARVQGLSVMYTVDGSCETAVPEATVSPI